MKPLSGKRILMFVGEIYEDLELWYPKYRLEEEGAEVVLAGMELAEYQGKNGYPARADVVLDEETVQESCSRARITDDNNGLFDLGLAQLREEQCV